MKKASKTSDKKEIELFFKNIKNKKPDEVKKIKRVAMRHNIPLKNLKKKFCKKCLAPYINSKIRIKNKIKNIICEKCGYISRWKIKLS